jgi:Iron-sulfur cluster binding domain of dihydroorotate dehydrogenase B
VNSRLDWTAGAITRIELDTYGRPAAWIKCSARVIPAAGQYVLARASGDEPAPLALALFPSTLAPDRFQTAGLPPHWGPGTSLKLRGPLGRGFELPAALSRLALASLGEGGARLRPLMNRALSQGLEVALFDDQRSHGLPPAVEAYPLSGLAEALSWADFLALDVPYTALAQLNRIFGPRHALHYPLPAAQALIAGPMPCGSCADCGVCALQTRRSWKLACKDGPVFDLEELDW